MRNIRKAFKKVDLPRIHPYLSKIASRIIIKQHVISLQSQELHTLSKVHFNRLIVAYAHHLFRYRRSLRVIKVKLKAMKVIILIAIKDLYSYKSRAKYRDLTEAYRY